MHDEYKNQEASLPEEMIELNKLEIYKMGAATLLTKGRGDADRELAGRDRSP
jgi:hypothetical protein